MLCVLSFCLGLGKLSGDRSAAIWHGSLRPVCRSTLNVACRFGFLGLFLVFGLNFNEFPLFVATRVAHKAVHADRLLTSYTYGVFYILILFFYTSL